MLISLFEQSTIKNRSAFLSRHGVLPGLSEECALCLGEEIVCGESQLILQGIIDLLNCSVLEAVVRISIINKLLMIG